MSALSALTAAIAGRHVVVVGDVMLDHFLIGRVDRISPEAPVPVVRFERDDLRLGGAMNVAHNVVRLGGRADIVGLVGADETAAELKQHARDVGIDDGGLVVDPGRPTTRKTRIVTTRSQQVARVDRESDADVPAGVLAALVDRVTAMAGTADVVVLSDYGKGTISPDTIRAATAAAGGRVPVVVDPKSADADRYRDTTIITPNHHEAELMTQMSIRTTDDARRAGRRLHERTGANVLITWGEHGMWIFDARSTPTVEQALPAIAREVADVTGAGDTVIAVLALATAAGASLADAARLANIAAGLAVARFGPTTVTPDELSAAVATKA